MLAFDRHSRSVDASSIHTIKANFLAFWDPLYEIAGAFQRSWKRRWAVIETTNIVCESIDLSTLPTAVGRARRVLTLEVFPARDVASFQQSSRLQRLREMSLTAGNRCLRLRSLNDRAAHRRDCDHADLKDPCLNENFSPRAAQCRARMSMKRSR